MKPRDLYGLAVRIAGLVFFVYAVFDGFRAFAPQFGLEVENVHSTPTLEAATILWFVLGLACTFGAGLLTWLAYGPDKSN